MKQPAPRPLPDSVKEAICLRVAEGATVRECAGKDGLPSKSAIFLALRHDKDFAEAYGLARELQLSCWEDELLAIANDTSKDRAADGSHDVEHIARAKLRVNTLQWILSRRDPRRYGDRVAAELSGPGGGALQIEHGQSPLELARMVAFTMELAKRNPAPEPALIEATADD